MELPLPCGDRFSDTKSWGKCEVEYLPGANSDPHPIVRDKEGEENRGRQSSAQPARRKPVFCLYVCGAAQKSTKSIVNLKLVLARLFKEGYDLRVVDICQDPEAVEAAQFTAPRMLIGEHPLPILRIRGDFSSAESIRWVLCAGRVQANLGE